MTVDISITSSKSIGSLNIFIVLNDLTHFLECAALFLVLNIFKILFNFEIKNVDHCVASNNIYVFFVVVFVLFCCCCCCCCVCVWYHNYNIKIVFL